MGVRKIWLVAAVWLVVGAAAPARAQLIWDLTLAGVPTSTFAATPGGSVTIDVYLRGGPNLVGTTGLSGQAILTNEMLFGAGISVVSSLPNVAVVSSINDITPNPVFNGFPPTRSVDVAAGTASLQEQNFVPGTAVAPSPAPNGGVRVLIGSFRFSALTGGTTALTVRDIISPPGDSTNTGTNRVLDALITNGTANLVVAAVPEPGSLALVGLAVTAFAVRRYRRVK